MMPELKLTAYDKQTERLTAGFAQPRPWIAYGRGVAGVPDTDPRLLGVYPLTPEQVVQIAQKATLSLEPAKHDFCLESFAPARKSRASAG
jgi:hypothetical protein